jgi:hypothetical protein
MSTVSWQTAPPSIYIYIPAASAGYIAYSVLCVYIYIYIYGLWRGSGQNPNTTQVRVETALVLWYGEDGILYVSRQA